MNIHFSQVWFAHRSLPVASLEHSVLCQSHFETLPFQNTCHDVVLLFGLILGFTLQNKWTSISDFILFKLKLKTFICAGLHNLSLPNGVINVCIAAFNNVHPPGIKTNCWHYLPAVLMLCPMAFLTNLLQHKPRLNKIDICVLFSVQQIYRHVNKNHPIHGINSLFNNIPKLLISRTVWAKSEEE